MRADNVIEMRQGEYDTMIEERDALRATINGLMAMLGAVNAFFRGEDDSCGLPVDFDKMADYEPVDVTLNARTIRAIQKVLGP
jgi:hypothetical protein